MAHLKQSIRFANGSQVLSGALMTWSAALPKAPTAMNARHRPMLLALLEQGGRAETSGHAHPRLPARRSGDRSQSGSLRRRPERLALAAVPRAALPALAGLLLTVMGCHSFHYTDNALARERAKLTQDSAAGGWWNRVWWGGLYSPEPVRIDCPRAGSQGFPHQSPHMPLG